MTYDLVVAYRIYPKISKVPPAYPNDKYKLSKLCLESFKKATEGINIKVYALLDNCPKEYEDLFTENFKKENLEIINLDNIGNKATFKKQIEILSNQNDSDIVYFAEDDYFYIKNIKNLVEFIKSGQADFATPYEHPACYDSNNALKNTDKVFENQKYTTVQHACLTFMTKKNTLISNKRYLSIFSNWFGSDFVIWGCITLGIKFFKYAKLIIKPKNYGIENMKVFGSMWIFAWHRFILNKKYTLYMPIETFATHMESNYLSPNIDWDVYFKDKK